MRTPRSFPNIREFGIGSVGPGPPAMRSAGSTKTQPAGVLAVDLFQRTESGLGIIVVIRQPLIASLQASRRLPSNDHPSAQSHRVPQKSEHLLAPRAQSVFLLLYSLQARFVHVISLEEREQS
jgi:hypothetical protein